MPNSKQPVQTRRDFLGTSAGLIAAGRLAQGRIAPRARLASGQGRDLPQPLLPGHDVHLVTRRDDDRINNRRQRNVRELRYALRR